jgi:hypothetical protein
MNNKAFMGVIFCVALVGCSKDSPLYNNLAQNKQPSVLLNAGGGMTQLSGIGFFDATDVC